MFHLILKPHRASLGAGTVEAQKVFALLKVIPDAQAAQTHPPLALCLVMDSSDSMRDPAPSSQLGALLQPGAGHTTKLERMIEPECRPLFGVRQTAASAR